MSVRLDVKGLSVFYGRLRAVDDVNFVVPAGTIVALLGPNGAGKSSVLGAISGLVRPMSGTVLFGGRPIESLPSHRIARLGVCHVPERGGIFPSLTVLENLALAARDARAALDRVATVFPMLADRSGTSAGDLSGGQQQMLALGRALASEAQLILLDELSLGLAPVLVDDIYEAVVGMRDAGRTAVLVEQHVSRALACADLVVVMSQGHLVFYGEPGELEHAADLAGAYLGRS